MVTWAALLVLQGVEGGVGEPDGQTYPAHFLPHLTLLQIFHWYRTY